MSKKIEHVWVEGVELKHCSVCGQWLPLIEFVRNNRSWDNYGICLNCKKETGRKHRERYKEGIRERSKRYYALHKEELAEKGRDYRSKNKDKVRLGNKDWLKRNPDKRKKYTRKGNLKHNFGITVEEYDTLFLSQNGVCAICGSPPNGNRLSVDHDHTTGKIRGLLCYYCNTALGYFKDNRDIVCAALKYMEKE